jgi:hypothetical protein
VISVDLVPYALYGQAPLVTVTVTVATVTVTVAAAAFAVTAGVVGVAAGVLDTETTALTTDTAFTGTATAEEAADATEATGALPEEPLLPAFAHAEPEHFLYSERALGPPQNSVLSPLHFMLQLPKMPS